ITIDNISAGTTLQGLVNMINNDPDARNKVRATTIYDGSVYHLQVYGMDMGTDNQVVVSNTGSLIFGVSDFQNSQDAQNSQLKVDGFPSAAGGWIERATNSVDDVIVGLTLNLKEANPGTTIQLTVDTDMDAVKENVRDFVDQLNEVRTKIQELTKFDETTESGSILTGNYGVDMISQKLKGITADIGVGFEYYNQTTGAGDKYSALSQLGILTDAEQGSLTYGLLVIDEDRLDEVLQDDPEAVAQLMSAYYEGESRSSDFTYVSYIDGTTQAGNYEVQIVSDGSSITSATINGQAAIISGWEITGASGTDEAGLLIRLDNHGAGTYTGTVSLKLGKAGQLVNELTDLTKPYNAATYEGGPLAILERNYQDIMDNIDDKIAWEEDRIEKMERNLRDKYARLDATLGYYDQLSASLTSQIAQLDES
ncbi:MAG: flagellar filament capping protein FliD, partial [Desulfovibrionaceae bacterium]|nr:flagellar filament capping protein FliD [Desulfovibrionaceae bacterium]